MAEQSYKHHTRFDPKFHFFLAPLELLLLIGSIVMAVHAGRANPYAHLFRVGIAFALLMATVMFRVYALKNQDRLIRLEETLRVRALGGDPRGLVTEQCVGLRFASDAEVVALADRAVREKMTKDQIKQAVQHWRADNERI